MVAALFVGGFITLMATGVIEPPRGHYLLPLIDLLPHEAPLWSHLRQGLDELTPYAIQGRYFGEELDGEDARFARRLAREVRSLIRERLGLG